jgi:hypothetical protein
MPLVEDADVLAEPALDDLPAELDEEPRLLAN